MLERAAQAAALRNGAALWYLGRDLLSVFGDNNGTTPPAIGGAAGLLLDRSYGLAGSLGLDVYAATASVWTLGAGWSFAASTLTASAATTAVSSTIGVGAQRGRTYRIAFTVETISAGSVKPIISSGVAGVPVSAPGTYSQDLTATSAAGDIGFMAHSTFTGSVKNISVREVVGDAVGPELCTNGTFDADLSGWASAHTAPSTVVWSGGQAVWQTDGAANARLRQSIATVVGATYRIRCVGSVGIAVGTTSGGSELLAYSNPIARPEAMFVATTTTTWINTASASNGMTLDNVSVRQVLGVPASQATAGSRPTIVQLPSGYYGMQFNGSTSLATAGAILSSTLWAPYTQIAAAASTQTAGSRNAISDGRGLGIDGIAIRTLHAGSGRFGDAYVLTQGVPAVFSASFAGSGGRLHMTQGGAQIFDASVANPTTAAIGFHSIGQRGNTSEYWVGTVALACVAPVAMSTEDRITIERFAALLSGAPYAG